MTEEPILIKHTIEGVTELILNRPGKRNALNIDLMTKLCHAVGEAERDASQRVIIIRGEGSVFCSGLDLSLAQDPEFMELSASSVAETFKTVYRTPLVTIAAVHGAAIAGGAGLMSACDFVVASEEAKFGYPETRRGLVPVQIMSFLVRQLRQRDFRELVLLGELIDAPKAKSIGLINKIVPKGKLLQETYRYAGLILETAPNATVLTKKMVEELFPSDFINDISKALKCHEMMRQTDEAKEGVAAFLEKRTPCWKERS